LNGKGFRPMTRQIRKGKTDEKVTANPIQSKLKTIEELGEI